MMKITRTNSDNTDFQSLVALLDEDLQLRDGAEHSFYAKFNTIENLKHVVVCYEGDLAVGCGAFKEYDSGKVEIKRMFVLPDYRGRGIASSILIELELWASSLQYKECILETGKKQPEAIALYLKSGYSTIENYGQYKNVENSVCLSKNIC